jgi:DNA processing protein
MVNIYELALTKTYGIGVKSALEILKNLGSAEALFNENEKSLRTIFKTRERTINEILHKTMFEQCEKELEFINKYNIRSYFINGNDYPRRLKNIDDPPICLFVQGSGDLEKERVVAIVGSRNATDYGHLMTENIVQEIKKLNCTVISGLAYGIDSISHRSCIEKHIPTFGVLGHGLDMIYPKEHFDLAQKMKEEGGLVTEYFTKTEPSAFNFPHRNRIIAGLSDLIIVVEAAKTGGALVTTRLANDYNREVLAVPGRYGDKYSEGCNFLIESNRAAIMADTHSISRIMNWEEVPETIELFKKEDNKGKNLKGNEKKVYEIIKARKEINIDDISIASSLALNELSSTLLSLELSDYIVSKPGKIYKVI